MHREIDTIVIFAAGMGTRLKPITNNIPKPLVQIMGKPILHHVLEKVVKHGFKKIIINYHYMPELIKEAIDAFLAAGHKCNINLLYEPNLLNTGGTIKHLCEIGMLEKNQRIFTANSDSIVASSGDFFSHLKRAQIKNYTDFLLLVTPVSNVIGGNDFGDFDYSECENSLLKLFVPSDKSLRRVMYTGVQVMNTLLVSEHNQGVFSLSHFYQRNNENVYGIIVPETMLYHATFPTDIQIIEKAYKIDI